MIPAFIIKFLLGRWITTAEGEVKAGAQWLFATPVHILAVALLLSVAGNVWQWHERGLAQRADAKHVAAWQGWFGKMQAAYLVDARSISILLPAIDRQNGAVRLMGQQFKKIRAAESKAAATGAAGIAKAHAISATGRAEAATWGRGAPDCHTGPAGLAAAKQGAF